MASKKAKATKNSKNNIYRRMMKDLALIRLLRAKQRRVLLRDLQRHVRM